VPSRPMPRRPARTPVLSALAAATFLGACASAGSEAQPPAGRVVALADLPAEKRELWTSWIEERADWPERRARAALDPDLAGFLAQNLFRVMARDFGRSGPAALGERLGAFERARADLIALGPAAAPVLVELVVVGDGVTCWLAGDVLALMDEAEVVLPVAAGLADERAETRRRAAELLAKLPHARGDEPAVAAALERALFSDPEWPVRAQAALAVASRGARAPTREPARRVLARALADPDPAVGEAACEGLARLGDPRAVPALIEHLERAAGGGRLASLQAAQSALRALSGAAIAMDPAAWRAWWRENRRRLAPPD